MGLVCLVAAVPQLSAVADTLEVPEVRYPVSSFFMRPGFMTEQRRLKSSSATRSFAVVGAEGLSLEWLRINSALIKDMGAIVLVVNAFSKDEFDALVEAADGAMIMLMPGDEAIHDALGVDVYPVLIDAENGVIRQ